MKSSQKMFINSFLCMNTYLTSVIFQKDSKFYDNQNEIAIGKFKDESEGKKHKIGTYEVNKISLSCFDDKRFILAYFHKDSHGF